MKDNIEYIKTCPICGNTFITKNNIQFTCKPCIANPNKNKIKQYLKHIQQLGWSDLIDYSYKNDIINIIKQYDNNANNVDIYYTLSIILI